MLYLACTTISSVDLAQYGVSLAKDWVSVECGTTNTERAMKPFSLKTGKYMFCNTGSTDNLDTSI